MNPAALVAALALAAGSKPQRIVSLNVCTDQLLLQLVERDRIASVTHLAADPELSAQAASARGVPATTATAEEVILLRADLALAGVYGAGEAVEVLRRWGVPVLQFPPAEGWEAIRDQLRRAAAAVHEAHRAEKLLERMDASLAALEARKPTSVVRAIFIQHDGATFGTGTLADAVLRSAGFRNVASELGIVGYGSISLERLLAAAPDLVVILDYQPETTTLGSVYLRHPALRGHSLGQLQLPTAPLLCGTTETVKAVQHLVEWRERASAGARR